MKRGEILIFILAVLGVGVAAFLKEGGSEDDGTASEDRRAAAHYRKLQNSACSQYRRAAQEIPPPQRPEEYRNYLASLVSVSRPYTRRAESLDPPRNLRTLHRRFVALERRALAARERLIGEVGTSHDPQSTFHLANSDFDPIARESTDVAAKIGLKQCRPVHLPEDKGAQPEPAAPDPKWCRRFTEEKRLERGELETLIQDTRADQKTVDELEEELRSYPEDRSKILPDLRFSQSEVLDGEREIKNSERVLEELQSEERSEGCGR